MDILNCLLEVTVYTVLLFFIVIAIKKTFKDKMSPTLHFALWFLPLARLCIPFTIDSGIRLIVIPEKKIGSFQTYGQLQNNLQPGRIKYFLLVWLGGFLLLSIRMLVNWVGMKHVIQRNGMPPSSHMEGLLRSCRKELGIRSDIKLLILPNVTTPALTIELIPKLVIPVDILDYLSEQQLELVLKHELMHYKRRDHLIVLLLRTIELIYWFNPAVWLMSRYISLDMEAACDSMVVRNMDIQLKRHYALSLVQLSSRNRTLNYSLGMVFGNNERAVEKRIRRVFLNRGRNPGIILALGIMAVILFIGCFTTMLRPVVESRNANHYQIVGETYTTTPQDEQGLLYNYTPILFDNETRTYQVSLQGPDVLYYRITDTDIIGQTGTAILTKVEQ